MTTERRGRFSADEDREVIVKYGQMPTEKLAQQMERTAASVERRATILFRGTRVKGRWEECETQRLRGLFGTTTPEQVAVILRRTVADVTTAFSRLHNRAKTTTPLSGAELAEFKLLYGTRTDDDLTVIFGRAPELIAALAKRLCLSKDKAFVSKSGERTRMPRWDPGAVALLTELYPLASNHEIARRLGRSIKSVVSKAHAMRLKKDRERLRQMGRDNVAKRYEK